MLNFLFSGNNTVKKTKSSSLNSCTSARLIQLANSTLGAGNLKAAVSLPVGEDVNEWIAYNAFEFLNHIKLINGVVSVLHCNEQSCPSMRAGAKFEFLWSDGIKYKRPVKMPASEYIQRSLEQCQRFMDDESIFPTSEEIQIGNQPNGTYQTAVKTIFKRIFRIYAHLYHHHYQAFTESNVDTLLNTSFKHFIYFVQEFNLIPEKDLEPLEQMIKNC